MRHLKAPALIILLGGLLLLGWTSTFTVHEREQALVFEFKRQKRVVQEAGLHFKKPWEEVTFFSSQLLNFEAASSEIPTLDQKQIVVDAFAFYRISDVRTFQKVVFSRQGAEARLGSILASAQREVLGKVPMSQVLTEKRANLMQRITDLANERARSFGVNVVDVRIKRVDLPEANSQAIFRRMDTQRRQEARKIRAEGKRDAVIIRAEADKRARVLRSEARRQDRILRGEGEAKAEGIYRSAYGYDPEFFTFYRSLEALRRAANADTTTYVGRPDADLLRMFLSKDNIPAEARDFPSAKEGEITLDLGLESDSAEAPGLSGDTMLPELSNGALSPEAEETMTPAPQEDSQ